MVAFLKSGGKSNARSLTMFSLDVARAQKSIFGPPSSAVFPGFDEVGDFTLVFKSPYGVVKERRMSA